MNIIQEAKEFLKRNTTTINVEGKDVEVFYKDQKASELVSRLVGMLEWKPIATVYEDMPDFFLVSDSEYVFWAMKGDDNTWSISSDSDPCNLANDITHWLPLPPVGDK